MGKTAAEYKQFIEKCSEEEVQEYFDSLLFKKLNIMVKCRIESYMGEHRLRFQAVRVYPANVKSENKMLLERMKVFDQQKGPAEVEMSYHEPGTGNSEEQQMNEFM